MNSESKIQKISGRLKELTSLQESLIYELNEITSELDTLKSDQESTIEHSSPIQLSTEITKEINILEENSTHNLINITNKVITNTKDNKVESEFDPINNNLTAVRSVLPKTKPRKKHATLLNIRNRADKMNSEFAKKRKSIEKIIGENLLNILGIIIVLIGIGVGGKYVIENNTIDPITRVIIGYVLGFVFLGFAIKLKKNYINFSAVLLSGGVASIYLLTFFTYLYLDVFSVSLTFAFMTIVTMFTVLASIVYNKKIIAHLGMISAYAIPILLNDGLKFNSLLMIYITLINLGILFVSLKKYWKSLFYVSFISVWGYLFVFPKQSQNTSIATIISLTFLTISFLIFSFILFKHCVNKQNRYVHKVDVVFQTINVFLYYVISLTVISHIDGISNNASNILTGLLTLFIITLILSCIKFINTYIKNNANIFRILFACVCVLATIACTLFLDNKWISLSWFVLAVYLLLVGFLTKRKFYSFLSCPLAILSIGKLFLDSISMRKDWMHLQISEALSIFPIFNEEFFYNLLFIILMLTGIFIIKQIKTYTELSLGDTNTNELLSKKNWLYYKYLITYYFGGLLVVFTTFIFYTMLNEVLHFVYVVFSNITVISNKYVNNGYLAYRLIWISNYILIFFTLLFIYKDKLIKHRLAQKSLTLIIGIIYGHEFFFNLAWNNNIFNQGISNTMLGAWLTKYSSVAILIASMLIVSRAIYKTYNKKLQPGLGIISHIVILSLVGYEIVFWISRETYWLESLFQYPSYIIIDLLWAGYAVLLIILGIAHKQKALRISSIVLIILPLLKFFIIDIGLMKALTSIAKRHFLSFSNIYNIMLTITIGILFLVVSFIYNKNRKEIKYIEETKREEL